jgi:hypothetical protein
MPIRIYAILLSLIALFAACKSMDTRAPVNTNGTSISTPVPVPRAAPTVAGTTAKGKIDPCSLLSNDDIKAVQGEQPTQTQRSDRGDSGYIVSQCYYSLPTTSDSVVLNVTTAAEGAGARHPRDFWKETFTDNEAKNKKRDREGKERKGEEEEEAGKPEKITGLGDDAYWSASRVGGALYVLRQDLFFRISVGGPGDVRSKLNKSRILARKVLQRL